MITVVLEHLLTATKHITEKCAKAGPNHFMQIQGGGGSIWMFTAKNK